MEYFKSEKLNEHLYCIKDICEDMFYLIVGDKECTLLDTGVGLGSIKEYIKCITNKPVTKVFLTHGHVDHASGAGEFEDVYLNEKDFEIVKEHSKKETRKGYIGKKINEKDLIPAKDRYLKLEDGKEYHLDGVTLIPYAIGGHTKGSMMFYLKEMDTLLLGDACNSFTFLFLDESLSISNYLKELKKYEDFKCSKVLFSHGHNTGDIRIIKEAIITCEEILNNTIKDVPAPSFGIIALQSKTKDIRLSSSINEHMQAANGRMFNAVYNKNNL